MGKTILFSCIILSYLILISCLCSYRVNANESPTDFVAEAWDKLPPGWIVYTVPNETRVGESELIEARITRNITEEMRKDLHGRGSPVLDSIVKIGTRMRPELRAINDSFQIKPQFPEVTADRPIIGSFIEWDWDIIPLIEGDQKLKLDVYAVVEIPPYKPYYVPYPVFEKTIVVKVNPFYTIKSFLAANWQWILTIFATFYVGRRSKEIGSKWRDKKVKK
jgi:hypothetical protein